MARILAGGGSICSLTRLGEVPSNMSLLHCFAMPARYSIAQQRREPIPAFSATQFVPRPPLPAPASISRPGAGRHRCRTPRLASTCRPLMAILTAVARTSRSVDTRNPKPLSSPPTARGFLLWRISYTAPPDFLHIHHGARRDLPQPFARTAALTKDCPISPDTRSVLLLSGGFRSQTGTSLAGSWARCWSTTARAWTSLPVASSDAAQCPRAPLINRRQP
jgi:hypothetical protein